MNYWIFQAVPDNYDLRESSKFYDGMQGWWRATRYRTRMSPGDLVYFWLGGNESIRGIYGWGRLASASIEKNGGYQVAFTVGKRLASHIPVDVLRKNPALENLMILNMAIGSNFLINEREALEIRELIPQNSRPEDHNNG
jgi:hypothetical protein